MHTRSYLSLSTPPCTMSSLSFIQYAHCCSRFIIEPTFLHHFPLPFVSFSYHPLAFDLVTYVESHACTAIYHTLSHLLCFIHQTQCHLARSSFILPKPIYFITHTIDPMPASFNPCEESELSVVKKLPRHFGILILDYELMECQLAVTLDEGKNLRRCEVTCHLICCFKYPLENSFG